MPAGTLAYDKDGNKRWFHDNVIAEGWSVQAPKPQSTAEFDKRVADGVEAALAEANRDIEAEIAQGVKDGIAEALADAEADLKAKEAEPVVTDPEPDTAPRRRGRPAAKK